MPVLACHIYMPWNSEFVVLAQEYAVMTRHDLELVRTLDDTEHAVNDDIDRPQKQPQIPTAGEQGV